jgi:hypothetical protein
MGDNKSRNKFLRRDKMKKNVVGIINLFFFIYGKNMAGNTLRISFLKLVWILKLWKMKRIGFLL